MPSMTIWAIWMSSWSSFCPRSTRRTQPSTPFCSASAPRRRSRELLSTSPHCCQRPSPSMRALCAAFSSTCWTTLWKRWQRHHTARLPVPCRFASSTLYPLREHLWQHNTVCAILELEGFDKATFTWFPQSGKFVEFSYVPTAL